MAQLSGRLLGVLFATSLAVSTHAADLEVEVGGIEADLLENARAALDIARYEQRNVSPAQIRLLYQAAPEQISKALQPFGYYDPKVQSKLEQAAADEFRASFEVHPGEPVIVDEVHVQVQGPAGSVPEVRAALRQFEPRKGDRLQDSVYENSKKAVSARLRSAGYFDAKLIRHRIAVTQATHSADIEVVWASGERYQFGEVRFSESVLNEDFLDGYVHWEQGDPYSAEALLALQRRLSEAGYFSMVSVRPDLRHAQQSGAAEVPIDVVLIADERTMYAAGLYLSTDTGAGGRLSAERRWLNQGGHSAQGALEYSQLLQEASATYRIPQPGPFKRDYTFGAGYEDEETDSSRAQTRTIAAAEARERWNGFNRTLGFQYLDSDFEIASERRSSRLLYGEATLTRRRVDDVLYPLRSYSIAFALRGSPGSALSSTEFMHLQAQGKWIRSVAPSQRVILRGELGAMTVGDFGRLPPKLRFFAGGDRSVRGFGYEAIGESRGSDGVVGGKYLAVASAEYDYFFLPDWGAALFVDAGDAFTSDFDMHVGAGIGVRWKSPVGIVRLDLARAVQGSLDQGWRIHFVIGPDL